MVKTVIDIHCHLLPDIDDGPCTLAESISIARSLAETGFERVAATPHLIPGYFQWQPEVMLGKVRELNAALKAQNIPLTVFPGAEYAMGERLLEDDVVSLNMSRYVLFELPFTQQLPGCTEKVIFDLRLRGYIPVLAHPERCAAICADEGLFISLLEQGVLVQCNLSSFLGPRWELVQRWIDSSMVHALATDSHHPLVIDLDKVEALIGEKKFRALLVDNPAGMIEDRPIKAAIGETRNEANNSASQ